MSGLKASKVLLLIYSSHSNQSPHVKRELERSVSRGTPILPIIIEDVPMSLDMEYYLSTRQWIKATDAKLGEGFEQVVPALRRILSSGSQTTALPAPWNRYKKSGRVIGELLDPRVFFRFLRRVVSHRTTSGCVLQSPRAHRSYLALPDFGVLVRRAFARP